MSVGGRVETRGASPTTAPSAFPDARRGADLHIRRTHAPAACWAVEGYAVPRIVASRPCRLSPSRPEPPRLPAPPSRCRRSRSASSSRARERALAARTAPVSCGKRGSRTFGPSSEASWRSFARSRQAHSATRTAAPRSRRSCTRWPSSASIPRRRPRVALEAKTSHPGHLRIAGEPLRLRPLSRYVRALYHGGAGPRGRAAARGRPEVF